MLPLRGVFFSQPVMRIPPGDFQQAPRAAGGWLRFLGRWTAVAMLLSLVAAGDLDLIQQQFNSSSSSVK